MIINCPDIDPAMATVPNLLKLLKTAKDQNQSLQKENIDLNDQVRKLKFLKWCSFLAKSTFSIKMCCARLLYRTREVNSLDKVPQKILTLPETRTYVLVDSLSIYFVYLVHQSS